MNLSLPALGLTCRSKFLFWSILKCECKSYHTQHFWRSNFTWKPHLSRLHKPICSSLLRAPWTLSSSISLAFFLASFGTSCSTKGFRLTTVKFSSSWLNSLQCPSIHNWRASSTVYTWVESWQPAFSVSLYCKISQTTVQGQYAPCFLQYGSTSFVEPTIAQQFSFCNIPVEECKGVQW